MNESRSDDSPVTFAQIEAHLSAYDRDSITELILSQLNYVQAQDDKRYPVWILLAVLKWTYLYSFADRGKPVIGIETYNELLLLVQRFELQYGQVSFKQKASFSRSLLIMAYQQELINQHYYKEVINRQIVLFNRLRTRFDVEAAFASSTGIQLIDFFNYCEFTHLYLNLNALGEGYRQDGILHADDYQKLFISAYGLEQLRRFLELVTLTSTEQFKPLHKLRDEQLQLFETNFFLTKPFLLFRGHIVNPHKSAFIQTVHYFVYTYMKANFPDRFPEDFGKRMELYVGMGLQEAGLDHCAEGTLKRRTAMKKVADYLVEDDILVECKATELHPRSGILRLPNVMTSELNTSVIKAYVQMLATAKTLNPAKEWFGVVVTYREMYLGHGAYAWEEFMRQPVSEWTAREQLDPGLLPPQNLFFISLEYWDYMMQIVKDRKATIKEILLKTRECCNDPDPSARSLLMETVLTQYFQIQKMDLSYLTKAQDSVDFVERMHD